MDPHEPRLITRVLHAFRHEGVGGVVRRILPFAAKTIGAARARKWNRLDPPLTAVLIVPSNVDPGPVADRLVANRRRPWAELLGELIVITAGAEEPHEPLRLPNSPPTRHVHLPETDPAIVANTAVALATSEAVAFFDEHSPPLTTTLLAAVAAAVGRPVDALCLVDELPDGGRPAFEEIRRLRDVAFRRQPLINGGLFHPEKSSMFVADALQRMQRLGNEVVLASRDDPWSLVAASAPAVEQTAQRPPRVVYVVNGTDVRGGIRIVFEHCNRLRDRGIEALVVTFDEPLQTWFPDLRSPLLNVRDFPPTDVAVATFWTTANFVSGLDCARYYFIQHDEALFDQDPSWKEEVRKTYRLPVGFVTISTWLVELIRAEAGKEAVLIPNGINREMFHPAPAYERGDKIRILVEGNEDIFWKGMDESREVLEGIDAEVWTLGKTGLDSDRDFPYPPQSELGGIYSSCDILLKTSWYEGMPLPHMEAMACGCALVTTDVPGVRDYCTDGWNCLMAQPRDVAGLRAALVRMIEDTELRRTLIDNGLKTAAERFGWDEQMDRLASVYHDAAMQARTRSAASQAVASGQDPTAAPAEPLQ